MRVPGRRVDQRLAFTLIELLVVIALIGVLIALTAGAATRVILSTQKANSKRVVDKVYSMLDRQYKAAIDDANDYVQKNGIPNGVVQMAGGDQDRAKMIFIKLWLKKEFPQTFAEAVTGIGLSNNNFGIVMPAPKEYGTALQGVTYNAAAPKPSESSACLLMALSKGRRGVISPVGNFTKDETADTDNDGVTEIVDAWKIPIGFWRWPAGYSDQNSTNSNAGMVDPLDPKNRLQIASWVSSPGGQNFKTLCHTEPTTNYLIPIIASAGPDRKMGLDPFTMQPDATGAAGDNIYSYLK